MALKFQYNKTFLHQLNKELKVRVNALPTLKAKESALRFEVKKARDELKKLDRRLDDFRKGQERDIRLWSEFPEGLIKVRDIVLTERKIAGIRAPELKDVDFEVQDMSVFNEAGWIPGGLRVLKELTVLMMKRQIAEDQMNVLEYARKKTTQKVNLYEKVQIPEYQTSILKIKRFLEDEENLSKASQKILKARLAAAAEAS